MDAVMLAEVPTIAKILQPREYQDRIHEKTVDTFVDMVGKTKEATSVMIESPTGSGKTVMGLRALKTLTEEHPEIFGKKKGEVIVNWCAMRRNLLAQAELENRAFFQVENVNFISMFDKNPPECDILVFDECQHSCANSAIDIYTMSKTKAVIGLSATPYRADRQKLTFHKCIRDAGYRRLIADGYLAQFDQYMLPDWTVSMVTKTFLRNPAHWGKSIAFFNTVAECEEAAAIVRAAGLTADVVTGNSPREEQLANFEGGKTNILFNVYVLSEGFDCPSLKTVWCRPSSKGPTTQMCGRGFRKFGNKVTQIVQSMDSKFPFSRVATPNQQFVLDNDQISFRNVKISDAAETRMLEIRKAVLLTKVDMPDMLKCLQKSSVIESYLDNPNRRGRGRRR